MIKAPVHLNRGLNQIRVRRPLKDLTIRFQNLPRHLHPSQTPAVPAAAAAPGTSVAVLAVLVRTACCLP